MSYGDDEMQGPAGRLEGIGEQTGTRNAINDPNKIKKMAYTKLVMNQLGISHEEAEKLIDDVGVDKVLDMFKSPKKTSELEGSLSGLKKYAGTRSGMMHQIEEEEE